MIPSERITICPLMISTEVNKIKRIIIISFSLPTILIVQIDVLSLHDPPKQILQVAIVRLFLELQGPTVIHQFSEFIRQIMT